MLQLGKEPLALDAQLDDVRVPQQLQILNLALYPAGHVSCDQSLPVDDLQRDLLAADLMCRQLHFAERALAERLHNRVLAQSLARLGVACLVWLD